MRLRLRRIYGEHLLALARYEELLPVATEALRIGLESTPTAPWMTQLHHDVGDAHRGLGQLPAAAESYRQALTTSGSATSPWAAHLHRDLAMTLVGVPGQKKAALAHARQARKIFLERNDSSSAADLDAWLKKPVARPLDPKAGHR